MSNDAFAAIKQLLVPYARHFSIHADDQTSYVLNEELPHSRTMFAYLSVSRSGARLAFYPLHVFPELRDGLPKVLASQLKQKCIFRFSTVSAAEIVAVRNMLRVGFDRIEAQRVLNPGRAYYRKPNLDETFEILTKLVGASAIRRPKDVLVALPSKAKVPALFDKKKKSAGLVFKTITPAEHAALAKLFA